MKQSHIQIIIFTILSIIVHQSTYGEAGSQKDALPRVFGPISLGMKVDEFTKISKVVPELCHHCAENELVADLYVDDYPGLFPAMEQSIVSRIITDKSSRAASFEFFKGRLYKINTPRERKKISLIQADFRRIYGPESKVNNWKNGVSWLIWENTNTALAISYIREKNTVDNFGFYSSVGDVLSIEYVDKKLRDALESQEAKHPSRLRH